MAGFVGDGRTLYVTTLDAARRRTTWLVDADGRNPRRLPLPAGRAVFDDTFSPDGTRFVQSCVDEKTACVFHVDGSAPEPVRGTRNDSRNIAHVAAYIGTIWDMDAQAVLDQTAENARRCFGL